MKTSIGINQIHRAILSCLILLISIANVWSQADSVVYCKTRAEYVEAARKAPRGFEVYETHEPFLMVRYRESKPFLSRLFTAQDWVADTVFDVLAAPQIIAVYKPGERDNALAIAHRHGCSLKSEQAAFNSMILVMSNPRQFKALQNALMASPYFESIEQDLIYEMPGGDATNDFYWQSSWHLQQATDKDCDIPEAWARLSPNASATIAVFDGSGVDLAHEDMVGVWELPYDAISGSFNVQYIPPNEKHSTCCCGIPGGICNNQIGVAGIGNNKLKVQPIKIGYNSKSNGTFYTSTSALVSAYAYAKANPQVVAISNSYGSTAYNSTVFNAITDVLTTGRNGKGIMVFASSGNSAVNGTWKNYPASYTGVIAVGASTIADTKASFSNFGTGLTFAAPGVGINTIDNTGKDGYTSSFSNDPRIENYKSFSGTSAACPVAASIGALLLMYKPDLTASAAKEILIQSCEKVGGYVYTDLPNDNTTATWSNELGYGRINANIAFDVADGYTPPPPPVPVHNFQVASCSVPSLITRNETANINITVSTTQPSAPVKTIAVRSLMSNDASASADDVVLGVDSIQLGNGIGQFSLIRSFVAPGTDGSKNIIVTADPDNKVIESSETDNTCKSIFTVSTPAPAGLDMSVTKTLVEPIIVPVTATSFSCQYKIKNTGSSPISSFRLERYWEGKTPSGSTSAQSLRVGQELTLTNNAPFVSGQNVPGTYRFIVNIAQVNGTTGDANTTNNQIIYTVIKQ